MTRRHDVTVSGRITSLTIPGAGSDPVFRVGLDAEGEPVILTFVGFKEIPGFRVGARLTARGTLLSDGMSQIMYNPLYTFEPEEQ